MAQPKVYLTIQVQVLESPANGGMSINDLNQVLLNGDGSKPQEIMVAIGNFFDAIEGGMRAATVEAVTSTTQGSITGLTGGVFVDLNLT